VFGTDRTPEALGAFCRVAFRMADLRITCNDAFARAYMDEAAMHRLLRMAPVRPEFLWAQFLPRESYKTFYQSVAALYFQEPGRVVQAIHHLTVRVVENCARGARVSVLSCLSVCLVCLSCLSVCLLCLSAFLSVSQSVSQSVGQSGRSACLPARLSQVLSWVGCTGR
jgi:hypothetical protein